MGQTVEATQEVRQVRSESSDTQVHVSQHHVTQLLKKGPPSPMVRQDTRMQHVRRAIPWVETNVVSQAGKEAGTSCSGNCRGNSVPCVRMKLPNRGSVVSLTSKASMD